MHCKKTLCLFFLVWITHSSIAQFQNLNFKSFNARNGLASTNVDCIFQDRQGFVWMGTDQGLSRFDGVHFTNFHHDPNNSNSIGGNHVLDIKEDKNGTLWLAIENMGLCRINPERYLIENFPIPVVHEVEERYINTFLIEDNGKVLVATERGFQTFDPNVKKYTHYTIQGVSALVDVVAVSKDKYETTWALGYEGELLFRQKGMQTFRSFAHHEKIGIAYDWSFLAGNEIAISSSSGIYFLNTLSDALSSTFSKKESLGGIREPIKLFQDDSGYWWVINKQKEMFIYSPSTGFVQSMFNAWTSGTEEELPSWEKNMIDKDGNVWLVGENGVYLYDKGKSPIKTYGAISKYNMHHSNSFIIGAESYRHYILFLTNESIYAYDEKKNQVIDRFEKENKIPANLLFNTLLFVGNDTWWLGTNQGIFELLYRDEKFVLRKYQHENGRYPFLSKEILWLTKDDQEGVWISTMEDGLWYYNKASHTMENFTVAKKGRDTMPMKHIDFTEFASDGSIAARTHYGFAFKRKGEDVFTPASSFIHQKMDWSQLEITDLQFHKGLWWMSTQGRGLWSIDIQNGSVRVYTQKDGLASDYVVSILEDKNHLILGTSKGLSIFNSNSNLFSNYYDRDGLPSDQFILRARSIGEDGKMFYTTTEGLISFFPDSLRHTYTKPQIILSNAIIDNNEIDLPQLAGIKKSGKISLKYGDNLVLNFSPLMFNGQSDYELLYRLSENDAWRKGHSDLQISLDNIDPDIYDLQVKLLDIKSGMISDPMEFRVEVIPPFWKHPAFKMISVVIFIFMIVFIVRRNANRKAMIQQRKLEALNMIERERTRIAMELHDDIGGNLTAVSLMTSMLQNAELDKREKNIVNNISQASDRMVDEMNEIVWALTSSNDSLTQMIAYIREHAHTYFENTEVKLIFDIQNNLPEMQIASRVRRNIFLIYKESVHNIIKHSSASQVIISFHMTDDYFRMRIADNGVALAKPVVGTSTGNGMGSMRRRAAEVSGTLNVLKENGHTIDFSMPTIRLSNVI